MRQLALRESILDTAAEANIWQEYQDQALLLDAERTFLRQTNIGGEAMREDDQQRVRDIGSRHRWRNVDGVETEFLTADEIENLTIRAGTLTLAERDTINHHIVATIKMLEQLPWPKHLKRVPEFAGGHHERMDGTGYPNGLRGEEIPLGARLFMIADTFDALTSNRPYRMGRPYVDARKIIEEESGKQFDPQAVAAFIAVPAEEWTQIRAR